MKILLLGAKGQVGSEIVDLARTRQITVDAFDYDTLDITDRSKIQHTFEHCNNIDVVINAAAYTAVDQAEQEKDKAFAVNATAMRHLAEACRTYNLPLLHLSTDYVFDGENTQPYSEDDQPHPLSVYGKSKLAGEDFLRNGWEKHVIIRISWVFGRYGKNFVKTMLRLAEEKEEFSVVGDQHGCPTAAKDVAQVLLAVAEHIHQGRAHWGTYHYCNQPVTTWYEFAVKIIELARKRRSLKVKQIKKITSADYPVVVVRPKNSEMRVKKITDDYNIEQREWLPFLEEIVHEIVEIE